MPLHPARPVVPAITKLIDKTASAIPQSSQGSMPVDVISAVVAGSVQAAFKFGQFILEVNAASEETRIFAKLIKRVQADREEALKERRRNEIVLLQHLAKLQWVDRALLDIDDALIVIGRIIEDARVDTIKHNEVTLEHKFAWVLKHKSQFIEQQRYLTTCHISLGFVLAYLHGLALGVAVVDDINPSSQEALDRDASRPIPLRGPAARRPRPRLPPTLPEISPSETEPLFAGVMEPLSDVSSPDEGTSINPESWTRLDEPVVLEAAQKALDSTLGQPHPVTTLFETSARWPEPASEEEADDSSEQPVAGQIGAAVRQEVVRMTAAELSRRESILRRSRHVGSHFGS